MPNFSDDDEDFGFEFSGQLQNSSPLLPYDNLLPGRALSRLASGGRNLKKLD